MNFPTNHQVPNFAQQNLTIRTQDINTKLLVHDGPGIIGSVDEGMHKRLWQIKTVHAVAHWSAHAHAPIRILASCQYRTALAQNGADEDKVFADLERSAWTNFGVKKNVCIATVIPSVTELSGHHEIVLRGGFTHARMHSFFANTQTICPTWKHALASLHRAFARISIVKAHNFNIVPLPSSAYPELFFGSYDLFKQHMT